MNNLFSSPCGEAAKSAIKQQDEDNSTPVVTKVVAEDKKSDDDPIKPDVTKKTVANEEKEEKEAEENSYTYEDYLCEDNNDQFIREDREQSKSRVRCKKRG